MSTDNDYLQLAANNRGGAESGRPSPSRRAPSIPRPGGIYQTAIYETVRQRGNAWKFERYEHLDYTAYRRVDGRGLLTNGATFVVATHPQTTRYAVVVSEFNTSLPPITIELDGPIYRPDLIAARALEYREVSRYYRSRTSGSPDFSEVPSIKSATRYIESTESNIRNMTARLAQLDARPQQALWLKEGYGFNLFERGPHGNTPGHYVMRVSLNEPWRFHGASFVDITLLPSMWNIRYSTDIVDSVRALVKYPEGRNFLEKFTNPQWLTNQQTLTPLSFSNHFTEATKHIVQEVPGRSTSQFELRGELPDSQNRNQFSDISGVVAMSSGITVSNLVVAMGEFSSGLSLANMAGSRALGGNSPIIA